MHGLCDMPPRHQFGGYRHFHPWSRRVGRVSRIRTGAASATNDRTNSMPTASGKRTAKLRTTLSKRVIDALQPTDKPWIAWDDKLRGFGVRIHPSGTKAFIVNFRTGDGGRKAPNKRVVISRYGPLTANRAISLLRSIYRRPCIDHDGLRNLRTAGLSEDFAKSTSGTTPLPIPTPYPQPFACARSNTG